MPPSLLLFRDLWEGEEEEEFPNYDWDAPPPSLLGISSLSIIIGW